MKKSHKSEITLKFHIQVTQFGGRLEMGRVKGMSSRLVCVKGTVTGTTSTQGNRIKAERR